MGLVGVSPLKQVSSNQGLTLTRTVTQGDMHAQGYERDMIIIVGEKDF